MEIGEPTAGPAPPLKPVSPAKSTLSGALKGPGGPLKDWPFLLRRDGRPVDQGGLDGGSSSNAYRDGTWWSDGQGKFKFEQMPEGCFAIEVVLPRARLVAGPDAAPEPANESGLRAATPPFDRSRPPEDPEG